MVRLELPVVVQNETPDLCGPCGGECCKNMPGAYHPAQFGPDLEGVYELLAAGKASIDWWEGDTVKYPDAAGELVKVEIPHQGYFLRPAIKPGRRTPPSALASLFGADDGDGGVFDPTYGGECVNLGPTGCALAYADRPLNCQALVANPDRDQEAGVMCHVDPALNKPGLVVAWNPYAPKLREIGDRVQTEAYARV